MKQNRILEKQAELFRSYGQKKKKNKKGQGKGEGPKEKLNFLGMCGLMVKGINNG